MNMINEPLELDPPFRYEIAYLREIADFLNSHLNMKRFSVDANGECCDGEGNIVDPKRFQSMLDAVTKELKRNTEKAEWLLSLYQYTIVEGSGFMTKQEETPPP